MRRAIRVGVMTAGLVVGLPLLGGAGMPVWTSAAHAQTATPGAGAGLTAEDVRALIEASQATAKASREAVDYGRVVPDILTQILAKLDKIEDKLARIEDLQKAANRRGGK
jgi:hypothetical protein